MSGFPGATLLDRIPVYRFRLAIMRTGSFFSILPILAYLLLWTVLGIFFLLKEVPIFGDFFSVVLSFGPFLLIFGSLLLCLSNLGLLFFVAPMAAFQSLKNSSLKTRVQEILVKKLLTALILLTVALIPTLIVGSLLSLAAIMTHESFLVSKRSLTVALEWFFIMLPFCAILSPAVVFFFNFAAESYQLLQGIESPADAIYGEKVSPIKQ